MSTTLPSLFVSHGAPTLAVESNAVTQAWGRLAQELPRPESILMVSAHWDTPAPAVSSASKPETIHDFSGFPRELYDVRYPASGAPALARRAKALLDGAGLETAVDPARGLDHGAWVPLKWMYPEADIPVTQLAVQSRLGTKHHHDLGRALAPLRKEGVLVFGSGGIVHNLRELDWGRTGAVMDWARAFNDWIALHLERGDTEALLDYRKRAPQPARAHPTEEHFDPFFVAMGAGGKPKRIDLGFDYGSLGMDAWLFQ
ncbi:dioxygenase [Betaproteobacteria bacterium GR16-43]|nr:dioxygenase [Betaproteobacteria bacterium GR16-43]